MTTLTGWLTIINLVFLVLTPIGGAVILRSSLRKAENDVQERVREALSAENTLLQSRVHRLETENKRMSRVMQLIVTTLKKTHGIDLDIEEDVITLRSPNGNVSRVSADI